MKNNTIFTKIIVPITAFSITVFGFVGCRKIASNHNDPEEPTEVSSSSEPKKQDETEISSNEILDDDDNVAFNISDLETKYPQQFNHFVDAQTQHTLQGLGFEGEVSVSANAKESEEGITGFDFSIVQDEEEYYAKVEYKEPIKFYDVTQVSKDEIPSSIQEAFENATTTSNYYPIKSVDDLLEKHLDKAQNYLEDCFDEVLQKYGILSREATLKNQSLLEGEGRVLGAEFEFAYINDLGHEVNSTATLKSEISFKDIVNENTQSVLDNAQISKQDALHSVSSYEELIGEFNTEINDFMIDQLESAVKKYNLSNIEITTTDAQILYDENGITGMVMMLEDEDKTLHTIEVSYADKISFSSIANYYDSATKEGLNMAMSTATSTYEATLNLSAQEILANYQEQINANLFSGVEACAKNFATNVLRKDYDVNNIEGYQWYLNIDENNMVQNLTVNFDYNDQKGQINNLVYDVSLKNPTSIFDLAKENNPATFNKVKSTNSSNYFVYGIQDQTKYADFKEIVTEKLSQQDNTFDYANAKASINYVNLAELSVMDVIYEKDGIIRKVVIAANGDTTSTTQHCIDVVLKNLKNDDFTWRIENEYTIEGTNLNYVDCQNVIENTK